MARSFIHKAVTKRQWLYSEKSLWKYSGFQELIFLIFIFLMINRKNVVFKLKFGNSIGYGHLADALLATELKKSN